MARRWHSRCAIAVLCWLAATAGCKSRAGRQGKGGPVVEDGGSAVVLEPPDREAERVIIADLQVRTVPPAHPREIGEPALAGDLRRLLIASGRFYPDSDLPLPLIGRRAAVLLSINYDVIADGDDLTLLAAVEIEVDWQDGDDVAPLARVLAERPVAPRARDAEIDRAIGEHVAAAVTRATRDLIAKEALRTAAPDAIVSALDGSNVDAVLWALALVRERKLAAGFDGAIRLLDSPERDLRETAVGALIAIGDLRAVATLADKVELSDYEFLRVVIEAVSALGGEEATSFLEFVASGHPDREIRERAAQGLERVARAKPPN